MFLLEKDEFEMIADELAAYAHSLEYKDLSRETVHEVKRRWIDAIELRSLVLLHVTRFVGIYFLILHERGELPRAFAVPGGIGDIVVATMALPVALAPLDDAARCRAIRIWNIVGLVDIIMVIITAMRINLSTPGQLRPLTHLPLSLLPTFLVPLIIATHIIIFARTSRPQSTA